VSSIIHSDLGGVNVAARRYDEAIQQLRGTVEVDPEFYWAHRFLGMALELKGDTEGAIAEYKKALELNDDRLALRLLVMPMRAAGGRGKRATCWLSSLRRPERVTFSLMHSL
jgi:tetratricopeptide (TPR) repeat protein